MFGECEQQELKDRIAVFRSEYDRLHKMFVERGNEMTKLKEDNERMRGALSTIAEEERPLVWGGYTLAIRIAKTALEENNDE